MAEIWEEARREVQAAGVVTVLPVEVATESWVTVGVRVPTPGGSAPPPPPPPPGGGGVTVGGV